MNGITHYPKLSATYPGAIQISHAGVLLE